MTFHNSVLIQDDNFHTVKGGGDIELHDKDCDDKEDNRRPPPPPPPVLTLCRRRL